MGTASHRSQSNCDCVNLYNWWPRWSGWKTNCENCPSIVICFVQHCRQHDSAPQGALCLPLRLQQPLSTKMVSIVSRLSEEEASKLAQVAEHYLFFPRHFFLAVLTVTLPFTSQLVTSTPSRAKSRTNFAPSLICIPKIEAPMFSESSKLRKTSRVTFRRLGIL